MNSLAPVYPPRTTPFEEERERHIRAMCAALTYEYRENWFGKGDILNFAAHGEQIIDAMEELESVHHHYLVSFRDYLTADPFVRQSWEDFVTCHPRVKSLFGSLRDFATFTSVFGMAVMGMNVLVELTDHSRSCVADAMLQTVAVAHNGHLMKLYDTDVCIQQIIITGAILNALNECPTEPRKQLWRILLSLPMEVDELCVYHDLVVCCLETDVPVSMH